MREIRYRAKCCVDHHWHEGRPYQNCGVWVMECTDETGRLRRVEPETITEWTGLRDKNGVRIFEDDILKHDEGDLMIVKFGNRIGCAAWCVTYLDRPALQETLFEYDASWCYEVIGNKFDNPELVRRENET